VPQNQPEEVKMDNSTKGSGKPAASASEDVADRLKQKASEVVDSAQEKFGEAYDEVSARAVEAGDAVREYAHQAGGMLDESLKTRPIQTLIGAVAVGFVLGAIWKS
jgi:ElaB/YqjD/DUF883 family membrane-anchored ribosome-binding protein